MLKVKTVSAGVSCVRDPRPYICAAPAVCGDASPTPRLAFGGGGGGLRICCVSPPVKGTVQ